MIANPKCLYRVALLFKTKMVDTSSSFTWCKIKCMSIKRYWNRGIPVLCASLNTAQSPRIATHFRSLKSAFYSSKLNIPGIIHYIRSTTFPCKIWSEVNYLFCEKIHVQQKVTLFMEEDPSFLKAGCEISAAFWFSKLAQGWNLSFTQNPSLAGAMMAEFRFLRSSLALGIETIVARSGVWIILDGGALNKMSEQTNSPEI
jgi:hypothetical protein